MTSNTRASLMLFCALVVASTGKMPLADALAILPLADRLRLPR